MKLSQTSDDDVLVKLKIKADEDELRQLALAILDAIDNERSTIQADECKVIIKCTSRNPA